MVNFQSAILFKISCEPRDILENFLAKFIRIIDHRFVLLEYLFAAIAIIYADQKSPLDTSHMNEQP